MRNKEGLKSDPGPEETQGLDDNAVWSLDEILEQKEDTEGSRTQMPNRREMMPDRQTHAFPSHVLCETAGLHQLLIAASMI